MGGDSKQPNTDSAPKRLEDNHRSSTNGYGQHASHPTRRHPSGQDIHEKAHRALAHVNNDIRVELRNTHRATESARISKSCSSAYMNNSTRQRGTCAHLYGVQDVSARGVLRQSPARHPLGATTATRRIQHQGRSDHRHSIHELRDHPSTIY